jgi:hypothetical protein
MEEFQGTHNYSGQQLDSWSHEGQEEEEFQGEGEDTQYEDQYQDVYVENDTGWFELKNVCESESTGSTASSAPTTVTTLAFDTFYEIIWAGFDSVRFGVVHQCVKVVHHLANVRVEWLPTMD